MNANALICQGRSMQLQARQAELLWFLLEHYPECALWDAIVSKVWANDVLRNTVTCTISNTRTILQSVGWNIKAERGRGYRLVQQPFQNVRPQQQRANKQRDRRERSRLSSNVTEHGADSIRGAANLPAKD
jgi:DNA-binding winged helix-turn-helix (wHTH) protein